MPEKYQFKLTLLDGCGGEYDDCYRVIETSGGTSLYNFASAIVEAFGFDFDHAFGFYDNLKNPYKSKEIYTLFADMNEDGYDDSDGGSVKKTKIDKVFIPRKDMLFLFDYGDEWLFKIKCISVEPSAKAVKSKLIESVGEAPEQYPAYEEDEEEEEA